MSILLRLNFILLALATLIKSNTDDISTLSNSDVVKQRKIDISFNVDFDNQM